MIEDSAFTQPVEVGGDAALQETAKPVEAPEEEVLELTEGDELAEDDSDAEGDKPKKRDISAKDRIKELNRRLRERERELETVRSSGLQSQIDEIKKLLQPGNSGDNIATERVAPDPSDLKKYPLGALDDRYVEDLTDWKVDQKFRSAQQRQLEHDAKAEADRVASESLQKARSIVDKGSTAYDDFEEVVWEGGMRGDYAMSEPTFHALTEAEHSVDIAYWLASNKAEAARIAALSPYKQIQWVAQKNAEFSAKKVTRKVPQADNPASHQARGTSGKFAVDPATEDLGAFKRALFNR